MDYSSLVDVGLAAAIAWGAKRELGDFKTVMNTAITALKDNLTELTKKDMGQDKELFVLGRRVEDLEGALKNLVEQLNEAFADDEDDSDGQTVTSLVGFQAGAEADE